jgi:hypothetical protein
VLPLFVQVFVKLLPVTRQTLQGCCVLLHEIVIHCHTVDMQIQGYVHVPIIPQHQCYQPHASLKMDLETSTSAARVLMMSAVSMLMVDLLMAQELLCKGLNVDQQC